MVMYEQLQNSKQKNLRSDQKQIYWSIKKKKKKKSLESRTRVRNKKKRKSEKEMS